MADMWWGLPTQTSESPAGDAGFGNVRFNFARLTTADLLLLQRWFGEPHVSPYYGLEPRGLDDEDQPEYLMRRVL